MAIVTQKNFSNVRPISYYLRDEDRSLDLGVPKKYASQQGLNLTQYAFLLSANDVKNKNYTTNYLTDTKTEDAIFDLNTLDTVSSKFITTVKFPTNTYSNREEFLTIDKNNTSLSSSAFLSPLSSADVDSTQSFVFDVSGSGSRNSVATIYTYDGTSRKYLVQRGTSQSDYFDLVFDTISDSDAGTNRYLFNVSFDGSNQAKALLSMHGNTSSITLTSVSDKIYIVSQTSESTLSALSGADAFSLSGNQITLNKQTIDSNYEAYSNNFVFYSSGFEIDSVNTLSGQEYNFLMYNNYEENFISGGEMRGKLSYFNLKNQISNNNNVNKNLLFDKKQEQRYYNTILNNESEETSSENLKLNYNFNTAEYTFQPDKYTKFQLPDNILPFEKININDAGFQRAGAYAAKSPYYSDRVFKLLNDNENTNKHNENNASFLCSWLYDDGGSGVWYDRYYLPNKISKVDVLVGTINDRPFDNLTQIEQLSGLVGLDGFKNPAQYYDVRSSLVLEPNTCLYYARIGKSYVAKILNGLTDKIIKSDFQINSIKTNNVLSNREKITFNGEVYDKFTYPLKLDADQSALSLSFALDIADLDSAKAFQLIGNNANTGLSIAKNFYFTPFVIVAEGNSLKYYDNDFNLVNTTVIDSISAIKDVCYLQQNNDVVIAGNSAYGSKLLRVSYNGDVIRTLESSIASQLIDSQYTDRIFFGIGNKAIFNEDSNSYELDMQTLSIDARSTIVPNAGLKKVDGTAYGADTHSTTSLILTSYNSLPIAIPGSKGKNVNGKMAVSLSGIYTGTGTDAGTSVLFTDYETGIVYDGLSTSHHKINDINSYEDKIYIQSANKLFVYSTERELLSTVTLSTSAVSGCKIDFISEDFKVHPIVFSRNVSGTLLVDKIITTDSNQVSSYSLNLSSYEFSGDTAHNPRPGFFFSPTNFHNLEDTFSEYENKFCFITKFDNEETTSNTRLPWDTNTSIQSEITAGNWSVNYTGAGNALVDNSSIEIIEDITEGHNCISIDIDLVTGVSRIYVNGEKRKSISFESGIKALKNYLFNPFYLGAPNFSTGSIIDFRDNSASLARNITMSNINVFNETFSDDIHKYLYLNCVETIDSINFDIPTEAKNNIETINNFYSYKIPGNMSNRIKIRIKNGNLLVTDQKILENILRKRISKYLPATIDPNYIDFDFRIGNEQPKDPDRPVFLQPRLPIGGSNTIAPIGFGFGFEISTDLEPVLFVRETELFVMVV